MYEKAIKKFLRRLRKRFPGVEREIEKELAPLEEEIKPAKKKKN